MMLKIDDSTKTYLIKRIEEEKQAAFPKTILLDLVSYCNLKCSMCVHKEMKRKPGIMSWELYKKCIDEISEKRPESRVWLVAYGDPFILKDMPERIKYAKDKGLRDVVLNTNGTLMNYENAKQYVKAGLDCIYVGIDATTQEIYELLRVSSPPQLQLNDTVENVLAYKRALDEYGNGNQKVFTQFVVMDINKHQKDDFVKFWKKRGINVKIRPMISWAGKIETPNVKQQIDRLPCKWIYTDFMISCNGKVAYCTCDIEFECSLADITDKETSIEEIWNTALKKNRTLHWERKWNDLPDFCKSCLDWQGGYAIYDN